MVSLSRRCTMPARGTPASAGQCASSPFISVRSGTPAPGCTTRPAGLSITMRSASSKTMSSGIVCARGAASGAAGGASSMCSPPRTACARLRARAIDADVAGRKPGLQPVARILREEARERLVQPRAAELARHLRAHRRDEGRIPVGVVVVVVAIIPAHAFKCTESRRRRRRVRADRRVQLEGRRCRTRPPAGRRSACTARRRTRSTPKDWAEGGQVPGEARGALSLRPLRAAGAARDRLRALEGRRARLRARRGGPLHQAATRTTPTSTTPTT